MTAKNRDRSYEEVEAELHKRFDHHPPVDQAAADSHAQWRAECKELARTAMCMLPTGREQSLVLTALEEALMWGNAAIAREGQ